MCTFQSLVHIRGFVFPLNSLMSPAASQSGVDGLQELMSYLEVDVYKGLWKQAHHKYSAAYTHSGPRRPEQSSVVSIRNIMKSPTCNDV